MKTFLVPCAAALAAGTLALSASAVSWPLLTVQASNLVGSTHVVKTGVSNDALTSFSIEYHSGDHKIRHLAILPSSAVADRVDVALADNDGGDPFRVMATLAKIPSKSLSQTSGKMNCIESCLLSLDVPAGHTFVLRGFSFKRTSGDTNVRRISIRLNASGQSATAFYHDNGKPPFDVTISYGYIKNTAIKDRASISGARDSVGYAVSLATVGAGWNGRTLLQGFDVQFTNGDHHLRQFAIKRQPAAYDVYFNDQNHDDPYHAVVDYIVVKE